MRCGSCGGAVEGNGGGCARGGGGGLVVGGLAGGAGAVRVLCTWLRFPGTLIFLGGGGGPLVFVCAVVTSLPSLVSMAPKLCLRTTEVAGTNSLVWGPTVPNLLFPPLATAVTTGLLGGGGGFTFGARRGGRLAVRLVCEADLVTPGGLLGSGGPARLRLSAGDVLAEKEGLWLEGGGAGGGPRGATSAGNGGGARCVGGVSLGSRRGAAEGLDTLPEAAGGRKWVCAVDPPPEDPTGRSLGTPPAKSPPNPGGPLGLGAASVTVFFFFPSMAGALRSLVTVFLRAAPPRISDRSADLSTAGAALFGLKNAGPPIGGAGGGGGGMMLVVLNSSAFPFLDEWTRSQGYVLCRLCHIAEGKSAVTKFPQIT